MAGSRTAAADGGYHGGRLRFLRVCREATVAGRLGPDVVRLSGQRADQYAAATINRRLAALRVVHVRRNARSRCRQPGTAVGLKHTAKGLIGQIRRRESTTNELLKFLGSSALRQKYSWKGGLLARVHGTKDGMPAVASRTPDAGPHTYLVQDMATPRHRNRSVQVMPLEQRGNRTGAFAPEDWADPKRSTTRCLSLIFNLCALVVR